MIEWPKKHPDKFSPHSRDKDDFGADLTRLFAESIPGDHPRTIDLHPAILFDKGLMDPNDIFGPDVIRKMVYDRFRAVNRRLFEWTALGWYMLDLFGFMVWIRTREITQLPSGSEIVLLLISISAPVYMLCLFFEHRWNATMLATAAKLETRVVSAAAAVHPDVVKSKDMYESAV
jgi:hypothetical protein